MKRCLLLASTFALTVQPLLFGQEASIPTSISLLKETSKAISYIAKKSIPAVVFIESEIPYDFNKGEGLNPLDLFRDDFFNRFFGLPSPEMLPKKNKKEIAKGSGFIVSKDGYIITNNHVVDGATKVLVTLSDGKKVEAKIIGKDPKSDIAVIKIEGSNYTYLDLGNSDDIEIGEWVIAIGNPFGLDASVTVGVVSAKGRNQLHITDFEDFIQTDAAINPGNSGGPLIDVDGKVIGINTAIVSGSGGYMGVGFAVPSNMAQLVVKQLIEKGEVIRGYLGVTMQPVDEDLAASFNLKSLDGALAAEVAKDSPAEKAGLKQGDIIVAYNGTTVKNLSAFRNAISQMAPGTNVDLTVTRDGKDIHLNVSVGNYPSEDEEEEVKEEKKSNLGIDIETLTPELASRLGYASETGVVVTKVKSDSVAEKAGIKPGALIVAIDKKNIATVAEYEKALKEAQPNKRVLLLIKQGPYVRFVSLKLD
jgi:serine protease Do